MKRILIKSSTVLFLLNLAFLLVRLAGTYLPKDRIRNALKEGFAAETATEDDHPGLSYGYNRLLGLDQFTDCVAMEIAAVGDPSHLTEAVSPHQVVTDAVPPATKCGYLKQFLYANSQIDTRTLPSYSRYWHGPSTVLALFLQVLKLGQYRSLLLALDYGAIALAAICLCAVNPGRFLEFCPLFIASFLFSGVGAYGSLVSYAPAMIAAWLMIAGLFVSDRNTIGRVLMFAVMAGALTSFLDIFNSTPLYGSLFIAGANLVLFDELRSGGAGRAVKVNLAVAASWAFGLAGSYALKVLFTTAVVGPGGVIRPFIHQLMFRAGTQGQNRLRAFITSLHALFDHIPWLVYSFQPSKVFSAAVAVIGLAGWTAALYGLRKAIKAGAAEQALINGIGYLTAAAFLAVWVFCLPEHTQRHSWFTIRYITVWLAGGWVWALGQGALVSSQAREPRRRAEAPLQAATTIH